MIMTSGSWPSRLTALGLLLLVVLAGYRFMVAPALELHDVNGERIAQKSALLQRYETLAQARFDIAERLAEVEAQGGEVDGYWAGASDVLAATRMQDRASQAIQAHGGDVVSVQITRTTTPAEDVSAQRADLGLRISATTDSLAAILHDMETATPYMFIERLVIAPKQVRRGRMSAGGTDLDVRLSVFGYLRQGEPSAISPLGADE